MKQMKKKKKTLNEGLRQMLEEFITTGYSDS